MTVVELDVALFRKMFGEFADATAYPDEVLQVRWDEATGYVSAENAGRLRDAKRAYAVMLMAAHLARLAKVIADAAAGNGMTGVVTQATVGQVSVSLAPPPAASAWAHWLAQTPYGQQLSAYLRANAAGGFYAGGNPEREAFRRVGGGFGGGVY